MGVYGFFLLNGNLKWQLLNYSTKLLEKLIKKENYNRIVINFYAAHKGYSLGFNVVDVADTSSNYNYNDTNNNPNGSAVHTHKELLNLNKIETDLLSYDETELLFYINAGEIPPILIDLIDHLKVNIFRLNYDLLSIK